MHATPPPASDAVAPESGSLIRIMQIAMHVLFIVLLAVGAIRSATSHHSPLLVSTAAAVFLAWYLAGLAVQRRGHAADSSTGQHQALLWITGLVLGWVALLALSPDFAWVAFALYFLVLHVARRPASYVLVAVVLIASMAALMTRPGAGVASAIGPFIGMVVALGISWIYAALRRESEYRKQLVLQLISAQDDMIVMQEELARAQHEAGVVAERSRLARDIHDTLAQGFSSIMLLARAGLVKNPNDALLHNIESTAAAGLDDAREVVHALTPSDLHQTPLPQALRRLTDRLDEQSSISARTHVDGTPRALPTTVEVALLRIAQGALANVRLHSHATRAVLEIGYQPAAVSLAIRDDGRGFTEADIRRAPLSGSGFGIQAIRERVSRLGGAVTIESTPGELTEVRIDLPTEAVTS